MSTCPSFGFDGVGGVADALRVVDCQSGLAVETAFARLFGADAALGQALGLTLTLYVGILAVGVLTGRSSISVSALTPRMLGLGLVLTFATSWAAYQGVVWNLLIGAPDQVASLLIGSRGSATELFADRLDQIFSAVAEAAQSAQAAAVQNSAGAPQAVSTSLSSPVGLLNLSALMLLLGTVGVLIVARIALAALMALGPIFIILALFKGTRGLFEGWLKTSVLFAVAPLISVLVGGAALSMLTPVVRELAQAGAVIPMRLAVIVFLGAFVHLSLSVLAFKAAASLTSGWRLPFDVGGAKQDVSFAEPAAASATATAAGPSIAPAQARPGGTTYPEDRGRVLAASAVKAASTSPSSSATGARDRVIIPFPGARADPASPAASSGPVARGARTQGLAQRFRTPAASSPLSTREVRQ